VDACSGIHASIFKGFKISSLKYIFHACFSPLEVLSLQLRRFNWPKLSVLNVRKQELVQLVEHPPTIYQAARGQTLGEIKIETKRVQSARACTHTYTCTCTWTHTQTHRGTYVWVSMEIPAGAAKEACARSLVGAHFAQISAIWQLRKKKGKHDPQLEKNLYALISLNAFQRGLFTHINNLL